MKRPCSIIWNVSKFYFFVFNYAFQLTHHSEGMPKTLLITPTYQQLKMFTIVYLTKGFRRFSFFKTVSYSIGCAKDVQIIFLIN